MNKPSLPSSNNAITVAARSSLLSQVQVNEVLKKIQHFLPEVEFDPTWVTTIGDHDQKTSLRDLGKTDFFTKEVDSLLLQELCQIAIHSAKDLPDPLPKGLSVVALTEGLDPSDSLVLRDSQTLDTLPKRAKVASSSLRRIELVKQLRSDLTFVDIRGTIEKRLKKLNDGEIDGVVIAEAALIRLGLTHLNRIRLEGETVPGQGQLAVIARSDNKQMRLLFSFIDSRPVSVYLGLTTPQEHPLIKYVHCPIIQIVPRTEALSFSPSFTHIIFTSKSAVQIYCAQKGPKSLTHKTVICVGEKTAKKLRGYGVEVDAIAQTETAEGVVELLDTFDLSGSKVFWPHSSGSRTVLTDYFSKKGIAFTEEVIYDTIPLEPAGLPSEFEELIFTSPSTVDAYLNYFGKLPEDVTLTPIGPVTADYLKTKINF